MIYERVVRPLLFALEPEAAHELTLACLRFVRSVRPVQAGARIRQFGLNFPHRLGLAAGLDKNGVALPAWEALGFAFVEIGTITAQPQAGNPRPRLFRYPQQRALINRMGFNNEGAEVVARRLERLRDRNRWPGIPVGINIGKSRATPLDRAIDDYLYSFRKLRLHADYIALNVSSPNTPGLREFQKPAQLQELLRAINAERNQTPLLVKIAPDLENSALDELIAVCAANQVSGVIATNTTLDHSAVPSAADQDGGLSGGPLRERSTAIIRQIAARTSMPIIGCGGISDKESALEKIDAGATLLQIYTGLIYRGPHLIHELSTL